jgi:hypothetical protein
MDRLSRAIAAFDAENARDPNALTENGISRPRELVQAERLSRWVVRLAPDASEPLRLAARCQHLRRWEIPRGAYAEGRIGYLEWRKALGKFHADRAAEILRAEGYDEATIERVRTIAQKKGIKVDSDVQTMEDALCLAFLENEIGDFAVKHPADKVVDILRKTWRKMSPQGHDEALRLPLPQGILDLVSRALQAEP